MKDQTPQSKKISVSIGGVTYHLVSRETEAYMKSIAAQADEIIGRIAAGNPSLSNMQTYVLAIINLVDALTRRTEEYDRLKTESDGLSIRETQAKKELFENRDVNFELKKEMVRVSELNRQLMLEIASLRSHDDVSEVAETAEVAKTAEAAETAESAEVAEAADISADDGSADGLTARDEYFKDDDEVENADFARIDDLSEEAAEAAETAEVAKTVEAAEAISVEDGSADGLTAKDEYFKDDDEVENAEFARIDEQSEEELLELKEPEEKDYLSRTEDAETGYFEPGAPKEYEYFSDRKAVFPSDEDAPPAVADEADAKKDPSHYGEFTQPSLDEYLPSSR